MFVCGHFPCCRLGALSYAGLAVSLSLLHGRLTQLFAGISEQGGDGETCNTNSDTCSAADKVRHISRDHQQLLLQLQTAAFGAVLVLNLLNLLMKRLLRFKCNMLLLFINGTAFVTDLLIWRQLTPTAVSSSSRL